MARTSNFRSDRSATSIITNSAMAKFNMMIKKNALTRSMAAYWGKSTLFATDNEIKPEIPAIAPNAKRDRSGSLRHRAKARQLQQDRPQPHNR